MRTPFVEIFFGSLADTDRKTWVSLKDYCERVKYKRSIKQDNVLQITIKDKYAIKMVDMAQCKEGSSIVVRYGYLGGEAKSLFEVFIEDVNTDYTAKGVAVVLVCGDKAAAGKKITSNKVWEKGTPIVDVYSICASRMGLKKVELDKTLEDVKLEKEYPQGNMSDMELLQSITEVQGGSYITFIDKGTLKLALRNLAKQSSRTFTVGTSWVKSLKVHKRSSNKHGDETSISSEGVTEEGEEFVAGSTMTDTPMHLSTGVGGKKLGSVYNHSEEYVAYYGTDWQGNAINFKRLASGRGKGEVDKLSESYRVEAEGKVVETTLVTEGEPSAEINEVLTIEGTAKKHAGNYFVEEVDDDISPGGGYITTWKLTRNASDEGVTPTPENVTIGPVKANNPYFAKVFTANDKLVLFVKKHPNGVDVQYYDAMKEWHIPKNIPGGSFVPFVGE